MNPLKKKNNLLLNELKKQKDLYKPTIFWQDLSNKFIQMFNKSGLKNFRRNKLANNFFVPLYTQTREGKMKEIISISKKNTFSKRFKTDIIKFVSGENLAFKDYSTFKSGDLIKKLPYLQNFSESKFGNPKEQFIFEGKYFSRSSLNYLNGIVFLKQNTKNFVPKTILEIGGGFGSLAEILKFSGIEKFKYLSIDLPPLSVVSEYYLKKIFEPNSISDSEKLLKKSKININKLKKISCLQSWQIENLRGKIDLFVNFISFQEMEPNVVANYLNYISKLKPKYILLRNLREGKQIKKKNKIGVKKPTKLKDYINCLKSNYKLVARNTIPFGYLTYDNFHSELLLFKKI